MTEPVLSSAQAEALQLLQSLVHSSARRPTYLLSGPSGAGKSLVARALSEAENGWYWNFTLDGLSELCADHNLFHIRVPFLLQHILIRVEQAPTDLVVLDGLESALTGLMPGRRKELLGFLRLLQAQTTGRILVIVLPSQSGSAFLTPTDLIAQWEDALKVVFLDPPSPEALV